mmetsp:Transcript_11897/g.28463  ORF Transcript_11897/g.28463 Transcript_11897/m.28463 type:complete len:106 (-) Transcript_11897:234-551(-)
MDAFFNNMGEKLKEALPVLGIKLEEEEGKREKFAPFERPRSVLKSRGGSKSPVASHSSTPTRVQFVGLDEELVKRREKELSGPVCMARRRDSFRSKQGVMDKRRS